MSSENSCCVFGCDNTYKNTAKIKPKVSFYSFPKRPWQTEKKLKWINFVKRIGSDGKSWKPGKFSFICSQHFIGGKKSEHPRSPSYLPTIHPIRQQPQVESLSSIQRYERSIKRGGNETESTEMDCSDDIFSNEFSSESIPAIMHLKVEIGCQTEYSSCESCLKEFSCIKENNDIATSVVSEMLLHKQTCTFVETITQDAGQNHRSCIFSGYESVKDYEIQLKSITGVSANVFSLLLSLLPRSVVKSNEVTLENRLLMFLMKLKSADSFTALGTLFSVNQSTVSRIFDQVLNWLSHATKNWIFWPTKAAVKETMPNTFLESYPNCRVIIDCTEIKTERPKSVDQQNYMYSEYKGTYTVKVLIGITPAGFISYISKAYGGRSSDPFITNECGILNLLEANDVVLADKGFPNIKVNDDVIVVMPPFAERNQKQFTADQMDETYKVAKVRIHVERAIQRLKIFNILTHRLEIDLLQDIDDIIHVCCVLVNFQSPIIKDK